MKDAIQDAFDQGIKLGPSINKDRYICPDTGAHFEFKDMCRRINIIARQRPMDPRDTGPISGAGKRLNKDINDQ